MKKRKRIDKSKLAISTRKKIEDNAYRKSFKDRTCEASRDGTNLCGRPAIGAHVRTGEVAGMGTKPSDDLIAALCTDCHRLQEENIGYWWWVEYFLKPQLRRNYREWAIVPDKT